MSTQDAVDFIRRQANLHAQFVRVANDLERIGSLENAAKEAVAARAAAEDELDKVRKDVETAKALADKIEADAAEAAKAKLAEADEQAARILATASEAANDKLAAAEQAAAEAVAGAKAQADSARAAATAARAAEALADEARSDTEIKLKAAQAEHDKLTKALEKIRAQFKIGE